MSFSVFSTPWMLLHKSSSLLIYVNGHYWPQTIISSYTSFLQSHLSAKQCQIAIIKQYVSQIGLINLYKFFTHELIHWKDSIYNTHVCIYVQEHNTTYITIHKSYSCSKRHVLVDLFEQWCWYFSVTSHFSSCDKQWHPALC